MTCLLLRNYRKLCNLVMDVDEWGQVVILSMLTRYARTQFPNPEKSLITVSYVIYVTFRLTIHLFTTF